MGETILRGLQAGLGTPVHKPGNTRLRRHQDFSLFFRKNGGFFEKNPVREAAQSPKALPLMAWIFRDFSGKIVAVV